MEGCIELFSGEKRALLQPDQKRAEEIADAITFYLAKDSVPFNAGSPWIS